MGLRSEIREGALQNYRADVDGLRGLAVLAVVFFHAHAPYFSGGFVGVDVFFVISGFLITRIITEQIVQGDFSIVNFYDRRIRRIFPALFAVIATCMGFGIIFLIPSDLVAFAASAASASAFVANFFFWSQSGYFAGPSELKILLHLWSLSVEEQFYVIYPVILLASWQLFREKWTVVIAVSAVISFALSIWAIDRDPSAAFYLLPFRAWELMTGAMIALGMFPIIRRQLTRDILALLGLGLVIYGVVSFSELSRFPGWNALLPCVGSALILLAGQHGKSFVSRLLSKRPIVFIGLISYSLYLWHWPILAFARYYSIRELTTGETIALLASAFLIAVVSYEFIEKPFRQRRRVAPARVFAIAAGAMACTAASGATVTLEGGWPQRFKPRVERLSSFSDFTSPILDYCSRTEHLGSPKCTIGAGGGERIFLWGDSHAGALYGAFELLGKEGVETVYAPKPGCPPLLGYATNSSCFRANAEKLRYLKHHDEIKTVVLAARWRVYFSGRAVNLGPAETNANLPYLKDEAGNGPPPLAPEQRAMLESGLNALVGQILAMKRRVVLIYPIPGTGYDIPSTLARLASQDRDPGAFSRSAKSYVERQAAAFDILNSVGSDSRIFRVYPHQVLCSGNRCSVSSNGEIFYSDSHHLTVQGARLLVPQLRAVLRRARVQDPAKKTVPSHPQINL